MRLDRAWIRQHVHAALTSSRKLGVAFVVLSMVSGCGGTSAGEHCGAGMEMDGDQCVAAVTSGGSAGADGGSPRTLSCANPIAPTSSTIDDFETGISPAWYEFDDKSGTATGPTAIGVMGGAPGSTQGLQFTGTGFMSGPMNFGVGIGKVGACIDVSAYTGLTFWAKGNTVLSVELQTPGVEPVMAGGDCPDTALCSDLLATQLPLDATWTMYQVPWGQLKQAGFGYKDDFATRKVINTPLFAALDTPDSAVGTFEIDIDDIHFSEN